MRRPLLTYAGAGLAAVLLLGGGAAYWYERPTSLVVSVSRNDVDDANLIAAVAAQLKRERKPLRLQVVTADSASDASRAVDSGKVDLAVVRTDVALPNTAQTVVILHRDAAIIAAPPSSDLTELSDLPGHRIGILGDDPANKNVLQTALAQFEIRPDAVATEVLQPGDVDAAIRSKRVDAIMMVDVVSSQVVHDVIKAVANAGGAPPVFIPIEEAAAIAQRSPAFEATQVVKGAFGGTPPRPADEVDTLSVTHRLVANETVDPGAIATLTRFLLTERSTIGVAAPLARQIEAPSTDKGSALPVHPGAAAYIDDEEQTFFDRYSDLIYMGAMMLGVVASGATALLSRMNAQKSAALDASIARLLDMLPEARCASSRAALDDLQGEADSLLVASFAIERGADDEGRRSGFALVLDQLRAAIRDRRSVLPAEAVAAEVHRGGFASASAAE